MDIRKFFDFGMATVCAFALAMGLVACGDDSSSGSDDGSLTPVESEVDLAGGKKVTCDEKMEGAVAALVNGDFRRCEDGAWIKISREEALEADEILGYKGDASSSSAKVSSSSSGKVMSSSSAPAGNVGSSSSGKPAVDPEPLPEIYECPDGSFVDDEKDCPSSGSSSSDKPVWQYLNPDIEYGEFTDERDGQVYKTVAIGEGDKAQTWMAENLNYSVKPGEQSWCGGGKDRTTAEGDCSVYGRLYTWNAAVDACPDGWHLPSNAEWTALYDAVGGTSSAGKVLKTKISLWSSNLGVDEFGFSVLPAGNRDDGGYFSDRRYNAYFWNSTEKEDDNSFAWSQYFAFSNDDVYQRYENKNYGFSIRCLKGSALIPGTDPESSSDTPVEEVDEPAGVMPSGYYKTNCPEGYDCKDAATTEYLNQAMLVARKYGEILDTRDDQVYKTIEICDKKNKNCKIWMAQNLNYAPKNVSDMGNEAWSGCYDGKDENCSKYGRLYTWDVAMNDAACAYGMKCNAPLNPTTPVRGVCPNGWHLPSHYEFEVLIKNNDPSFEYGHKTDASSLTAGKYLKSLTGWNTDGSDTDASGFSALPGGFRSDDGSFSDVGDYAYIWSSGEFDKNYVFNLNLHDINEYADLDRSVKNSAKSVRCLKDSNPAVTPDDAPAVTPDP